VAQLGRGAEQNKQTARHPVSPSWETGAGWAWYLDSLVALNKKIERFEVAVDQVGIVDSTQAVHGVEQIAESLLPR